ncbi:PEX1 factor, partial [Amia calva]|nr:PEX1 factor [Amia calva]
MRLSNPDYCNSLAFIRPCWQALSVQRVFVEPLTSDDWEILQLHSVALEQHLLDQIRVVFPNAVFPVWVEQHTVIFLRTVALEPVAVYGRLEQHTELVISPKERQGREDVAGRPPGPAWPLGDNQSPRLHRQDNFDLPPSTRNSLGSDGWETPGGAGLQDAPAGRESAPHGGIMDLRSLIRYMFTGSSEPRPGGPLPSVPSLPPLLRDSVLRVCRTSRPASASQQGSTQCTVHVLPAGFRWESQACRQFAITYGRLCKLPSPRELRDQTKQPAAPSGTQPRKKQSGVEAERVERAERAEGRAEGVVIRVVCHAAEEPAAARSTGRAALYCGQVWIPGALRRRLGIDVCSAVRIQPLKSTPKLATSVRLQPLQTLPDKVSEGDVQGALLDWLLTHSTEELSWLTGRHNFVFLPVLEERIEFALTVVKPEPEASELEEVFLLTASLLQKSDIQILMTPQSSASDSEKALDDDKLLQFPTLDSLGGVGDIGDAAFEHLTHCLMGRPLSQELVCGSPGLRNGGLLLTGPKGSGKTALATALCRRAADVLDAHVEVIDCKKLRGKRVETVRRRVQEVLEEAVWRQPSVLLLDDLDQLAGASAPEQQQGPEAQHCQQLAHARAQRCEILRALIRSKSNIAEDSLRVLDLDALARETEGYLARDFTLLVERAVHASVLHSRTCSASEVFLATCDFQQARKGFTPPSLWCAQLHCPRQVGWERVGGLREVRQLLIDIIQLPAKYPTLFSRLPIRQCSGVLLYGAPGTGKTLLAGAIARESGMNFIGIKGPELLSKYIGASEQAVRDVFQRAQAAKPCILFFDEFDSLAPRRGHDSTGVTDRVVNQLLTQLDGVEGLDGVYVLAATSRPDLIDPALLRPGRLDKSLYCPPPDQEARLEILKALTQAVPLAGDVDLDQLAATTDSFTGADLKALLYNAQLEAIHSNLGANLLHDGGCGSDSDVSLSSMIFLNHSSGSDDSAGEGEGALENSMVLLDSAELLPEDPRHNVWRLYFGSSYESELGNASPSELNSQCLSGPNSMTHDLTGTSLRDPGSSQAPVFMASLQEGFQELGHEQIERLRAEIGHLKSNYRVRATDDSILVQAGPIKPAFPICQSHLSAALTATRASISKQDWKKYNDLYNAFGSSCDGKTPGLATFKAGQRVTLA